MTTSGLTPTTGPETPILRVAVGVLRDADGRVLVAERDAARHAGGGLEFPGGKMDAGESVDAALARELDEELGVRPRSTQALLRVRHDYPERRVELHVRVVDAWIGDPVGREGQAIHWYAPGALDAADFPAANRPIVAALRWPSLLRVTPAITASRDVRRLAEDVIAATASGDWIQIRTPELAPASWRELVERIRAGVDDAATTRILLNTSCEDPLVAATGFGVHLRAASLAAAVEGATTGREASPPRPAAAPILACAAHSPEELQAAQRLGVDFVVVGNVRATASHPGRAGIGWQTLSALTARTAIPVYAIGGVTPADLDRARDAGAVGVAGITAFWKG